MITTNESELIATNIKNSAEQLFLEFDANKENLIRESNQECTVYPVFDAVGVFDENTTHFPTLMNMISDTDNLLGVSYTEYPQGAPESFLRFWDEDLPLKRYYITNIDEDGNNTIGELIPNILTSGEKSWRLFDLGSVEESFDSGNRTSTLTMITIDFWTGPELPTQTQKENYLTIMRNRH